jgi:hypothetical protein
MSYIRPRVLQMPARDFGHADQSVHFRVLLRVVLGRP